MTYPGPNPDHLPKDSGWPHQEASNSFAPVPPPPPLSEPYRPRAPRRSSKAPWIVVGIIAVVALLCGGGILAVALSAPDPEPFVVGPAASQSGYGANSQRDERWQVVLEVTGSGKADVNYNVNGVGGSDNGVTLPWTVKLGPFDGFVVVSMLVQAKGGTTSDVVHGKITFGEKVWECHGQGMYATATCTGSNG